MRPRILFTTPVFRIPARGGPELRIECSIRALAEVADVHLFVRKWRRNCGTYNAVSELSNGLASIRFLDSCEFDGVYRTLRSRIFNRLNQYFGIGTSPEIVACRKLAKLLEPEVIWLGYGNVSYQFINPLRAVSRAKIVVDTDSVWSRFVLRSLAYAKNAQEHRKILDEGKFKEAEEENGTKLADVTTAVSDVDAGYYRKFAQRDSQVHLFTNVVDVKKYLAKPTAPIGFKTPAIFLAGTFWNGSPMEDAARWLLDEVKPKVQALHPNSHWYIAGVDSDVILKDVVDPNVSILGQVESVLPYLCNATLSVVPLRFESGTRFKILEAGACSIPVVSTSLGAEGLPVTSGEDILIADNPESFASHISDVISNPVLATRIGERLHSLVADRFSMTSLVDQATQILQYLART